MAQKKKKKKQLSDADKNALNKYVLDSFWIGGISTVLTQKITQEKLATFAKILNYTSLFLFLYAKILDIPTIVIAYKKNQHILM